MEREAQTVPVRIFHGPEQIVLAAPMPGLEGLSRKWGTQIELSVAPWHAPIASPETKAVLTCHRENGIVVLQAASAMLSGSCF